MSKKKPAKKAAPKSKDVCVVTMLLDESGSMQSLLDPTIAGFNEYVTTLKNEMTDVPVYFSAIKFDSLGVRKLQVGADIKDAVTLSRENYRPNQMTPLFDAIGQTIRATDEVAGKNKASKIIVVIQTDGQENASRDFSLLQVKQMIEVRQGKGWQFLFIGAGIDAFGAGVQMGVSAANTMSYGADAASTQAVFAASAQNSNAFRTGASGSVGYSHVQSRMSGESADITRKKFAAAANAAVPPLPKTPTESSSSISSLSLGK